MNSNSKPKPLVAVAACCEKVLIEKDGVASVIRIVDTFTSEPPPPNVPAELLATLTVPVSAFISLKSGDYRGESQLSLAIIAPDGTRKAFPTQWPVVFAGGEQGANLVLNFGLPMQKPGLYWLELLWNQELLTKIPVKLVQAGRGSEAPQQSLQ